MTTQLQEQATAPAETQSRSCPECGAGLVDQQQFCVECGAQVGSAYRPHPSWRLPATVAAIVLLIVGAGVAYALTEISSDSNVDSAQPAPTQTAATAGEPVPPAEQTAPEGGATGPAGSPTTGTDAAPQTEGQGSEPSTGKPAAGDGQIAEWPVGKAAFSVILFSTDTREGAEAKARQAMEQGIPAGVLNSDEFSSLRPGYWVVFAGQFDTSEEAEKEAESYASLGFGDGYPRYVQR